MDKKTKSVLIFASVVAIGYFVFKKLKSSKPTNSVTQTDQTGSSPSPSPSQTINQPSQLDLAVDYCNNELSKERIKNPKIQENEEENFLQECVGCYLDTECHQNTQQENK